MKPCILILPYFGKFPPYFPLFLKSCEKNSRFEWLIFTDDREKYEYPDNVHVRYTTLGAVREKAEDKLGMTISLETPYKLCDLRPAYGYLWEDDIQEYVYWGYCDCDVLFGDLEKFLTPLLERGYDKIFPAGHLTLYKNTKENNRRFLQPYKGHFLYKDYLTTPEFCWFDEDWREENIHSIFLKMGCSVFPECLAFNPSGKHVFFVQRTYMPEKRKYREEPYRKNLLIWENGKIKELFLSPDGKLCQKEYPYAHFQHRPMKLGAGVLDSDLIRVFPTGFAPIKTIPKTADQLKQINLEPIFAYEYAIFDLKRRIKRKWKKIVKEFPLSRLKRDDGKKKG